MAKRINAATLAKMPPADELADLREQQKAIEQRIDKLRILILAEPAAREGNQFLAWIQETAWNRIDTRLLRRDYPDIADAVTRETVVHIVRLRRRKLA